MKIDVEENLIAPSERTNSISIDNEIENLLDTDEFARYMATVCYAGTSDWVLTDNNVKGYRSQDDGKFHFMFFDMDLTWENTNNVEELDANDIIYLYRNLKQSKAFRKQFVAAYCILHGSIYTQERCQHIADSICALVKNALALDNRYTTGTYRKLQETMWEKSHREARIKSLMNSYGLSDSLNVNLSANCTHARIRIDGVDVPFSKFSGVLFRGMTVSTDAANGFRFIGWRDQHSRWLSREKECQITSDGTYTAVYEKITDEQLSAICINEVCAANDIYVNDYGKRADWIELYNRGKEPVDVAQCFFSDEESNPTKYRIDNSGKAGTIIQPNGHLVIWCDGKPSLTQLHLPLKLKNADNSTLILQSADGKWKDSIRYHSHSSKETVGRYPDGGSNTWVFYHPTIGTHNAPTTYDSAVNIVQDSVTAPNQPDEIESINYYTISGIRILKPQNGMYIKVVRYRNGRQESKAYIL